jgi:Mg2+ and Co2+ transporter CorA
MQTCIAYNANHVKYDGKKEDIKNGFKLWIDIIDPTSSEISETTKSFKLDKSAVKAIEHKSKNSYPRQS